MRPMDIGEELRLVNPGTWSGFGCDVEAVFTVTGIKQDAAFGSGFGVQVSPAIQPGYPVEPLAVWYDLAHFVPLDPGAAMYPSP